MSLLQNEDFKTESELVTAGGTKSQLLNDTKVYVTASGINKTLDDAIVDGDIGGGGGTTVAFRATANDGETITTAGNNFVFEDLSYNVGGGSYNTSTGIYTVGDTGIYHVYAQVQGNTTQTYDLFIRVNGSSVTTKKSSQSAATMSDITDVLSLTSGDEVLIFAVAGTSNSGTSTGSSAQNHFTIFKV